MTDLLLGRVVVVFPGGQYGPSTPLLTSSANAAKACGAEIVAHQWTRPDEPLGLPQAERFGWVTDDATPVLDQIVAERPGVTPVIIGKSLGTCAAGLAADRRLPAIWLTPLLREHPDVVTALRRSRAPFLLVGGTADPVWDGELARELSEHVLELPDADHGLAVPGELLATIDALSRVGLTIEDFLDQVVWA